MVDDYAAAVRDARPEGSVILGGVCLGGALAIEVANRLEQSGGEVSLLVLIDPRLHVSPSARWIRTQASLAVRKVLTGDYSWKLMDADRRREVRDGLLRQLGRSPAETDPGRRRFDEAIASIRVECTAKAYDAPVAIFSTIDYPLREWFWQPLLKRLIGLRELPHRHGSILRPPAVDELAQAIQTTIDERGLR